MYKTVAHRLDIIIENDLVPVLGGGKGLDFGAPASLIRSGCHFASMVTSGNAPFKRNKRP
jgi:ABC-type multidrug transport system fused ATPase/permease subunit